MRYKSKDTYNVTRFNKDWMVRHYPDSSDTFTHSLIGFHKFRALVDDDKVFDGLLKRLDNSPKTKEELKLRRGVKFVAIMRGSNNS